MAARCRWRGAPIDRLAGDYFEQVNYVGHHDGVKHELSCLENLRLARAMGVPSQRDLDDVLDQVNLYAYGETEVRQPVRRAEAAPGAGASAGCDRCA